MANEPTLLTRNEILERPGWNRGRIERMLSRPDTEEWRRSSYGDYVTYYWLLERVAEAEEGFSEDEEMVRLARKEGAKKAAETRRLRKAMGLPSLASLKEAEREKARIQAEEARRRWEALRAEESRKDAMVGEGLRLLGYPYHSPRNDFYRTFEPEEMLPFLRLRERGEKEALSPSLVEEFYRLWRESSGYCNRLGTLKKLIVPVKKRIAAWVLDEARKNGWEHGFDPTENVLYIDTPHGQCSWHRPEQESVVDKVYPGKWSGVRNTDLIVRRLLGEELSTIPKAPAVETAAA